MTSSRLFLLAAVALLAATAVSAQARPVGRQAYTVQIDGYVGTKPTSTPLEVSWTVSLKGEPYKLFVTKMKVLTGNTAYYNIIQALEPYQTAMTLVGDDDQLDLFATAPAQQQISVTGVLQFTGSAHYLMISKVDYIGSPPAGATPLSPDDPRLR